MKKLILMILMISIFICFPVFANEQVTICVNGVEMQTKGVLVKDRTFVPLRFVAEKLGAEVLWNEQENAVYINEKHDEVIPQNSWYGEEFKRMMQEAFEDAGLDFNKVYRKTPVEYAYRDENMGVLSYTKVGMNGNLFVELYGEGTKPEAVISSLWYFNLESQEYGKLCDRYSPSPFYEDERFSPLFSGENFEGDAFVFDTETFEKWVIPGGKILGMIEHTVYYLKDKLYVKNLKTGEEQCFDVDFSVVAVYRSYTDGKRIFIRQKNTGDNVFVLDLTTFDVTKCDYSDTEFDFFGRDVFGIRKTADFSKPPRIFVNNMPVYNIPEVFVQDDRTYVPLRFVAEELGAEVEWIDDKNEVKITRNLRETPRYAFSKGTTTDILRYN